MILISLVVVVGVSLSGNLLVLILMVLVVILLMFESCVSFGLLRKGRELLVVVIVKSCLRVWWLKLCLRRFLFILVFMLSLFVDCIVFVFGELVYLF